MRRDGREHTCSYANRHCQGPGAGDHDRTYLTRAGTTEIAGVHVRHDLAHLVVESWFDILDGLWGEFEQGGFEAANRAATARDARRRKQGRIASGGAHGVRLDKWLTDGHGLAKVATNSVVNHFGDGPNDAAGVRTRATRAASAATAAGDDLVGMDELLDRLNDETIESAIVAVRAIYRVWDEVPPGATVRLTWPLPKSFFGRPPD